MQKIFPKILNTSFARNGYLMFSPFLLYYIYYIRHTRWPILFGDESRYTNYANNLIHGFFSPPAPNINLWSGPGYPILLMPFVALHSFVLYMALLNAFLYYLSVVFLYQALKLFVDHKLALLIAFLWAVYPNMIGILSCLFTETLTVFMVTAFIYSIGLFYTKKTNKQLIISGLILGYLVLVKILFGYVILLALLACLVLLIIKKIKTYYLKSVYILLIAFLVTIPYLFYTFHVTRKVFYWGNAGGMSLYWMSTNYDQEYGDWKEMNLHNSQFPIQYGSREGDSILTMDHKQDMALIFQQTEIGRDSLFKKMAINNIRQRPKKFLRNYFYNVSRMLFNFPYSFTYHDAGSIGNIFTGSLIFWASIIAAILSVINWRKMIYPVKFTLLITLTYLLLAGALSAYPRMFDVIVPVLLFWIAIIINNMPISKFRPADNQTPA